MTMLTQVRFPIRDRAHAKQIAQILSSGGVFNNVGTVDGFADWLYVNRRTFNGVNPLQQVNVYLNRGRSFSKRGADFDSCCREQAECRDRGREKRRAEFAAALSEVKAWWSETPDGADITLAVAELFLGRGQAFARLQDDKSTADSQTSWVLNRLLGVFERLGGSDTSLSLYEWTQRYAEGSFEAAIQTESSALSRVRRIAAYGKRPSPVDLVKLAYATLLMARVLAVRTTVRRHLIRVKMTEAIREAVPTVGTGVSSSRRIREV